MLTQEMLKTIVRYDELTGKMYWLARPTNIYSDRGFNAKFAGKEIGSTCSYGYLQTTIRLPHLDVRINTKVHRLIWLYVYGNFPIGIDHINGDKQDNRLHNLREATQEVNNRNLKKPSHNTSGLAGVHFDKSRNKWQVQVKIKGKRVLNKRYDTLLNACSALISFRNNNNFTSRHGR